jgi:hypothetical protein
MTDRSEIIKVIDGIINDLLDASKGKEYIDYISPINEVRIILHSDDEIEFGKLKRPNNGLLDENVCKLILSTIVLLEVLINDHYMENLREYCIYFRKILTRSPISS